MNPSDVNIMMIRCVLSFSNVGLPRIRRASSARSFFMGEKVVRASPEEDRDLEIRACQYGSPRAVPKSGAHITAATMMRASQARASSVMTAEALPVPRRSRRSPVPYGSNAR